MFGKGFFIWSIFFAASSIISILSFLGLSHIEQRARENNYFMFCHYTDPQDQKFKNPGQQLDYGYCSDLLIVFRIQIINLQIISWSAHLSTLCRALVFSEKGGWDDIINTLQIETVIKSAFKCLRELFVECKWHLAHFAGGYMTDVLNKKVRFDAFEGFGFEVYDSEVPAYA